MLSLEKKTSEIKLNKLCHQVGLLFDSPTVTMMHGPIYIRYLYHILVAVCEICIHIEKRKGDA